MQNYVILDIETTGLSKHYDKITEIAAVKVSNGIIVNEFQTLINPERKIPSFITKLTGINNEMVKDKPTIDKVLPDLFNFLENEIIIAHNATFDHGFIQQNANLCGLNFYNEKLCTRKLANRLLPNLKSKKLNVICEHFNIKNIEAHRAMSDVKATHQVFSCFLDLLKQMKIENKEEIIKFEKKPKKLIIR
ncbi:MAG: PolC-type DNA polymerase III [Candidatus Woesearchaeota archaeon]